MLYEVITGSGIVIPTALRDELVETRVREGKRLREIVEQRLDATAEIVATVREALTDS